MSQNEVSLLSEVYPHKTRCWTRVEMLSPCEDACPLHMNIPEYILLIAQDKLDEALAVIRQTNPLPSICGRVCHCPCEERCARAELDEPIAIKWLKRFVADRSLGEKPAPAVRTKIEKVAIVGSGPAGLTAAYDLVMKGYGVTIYEASPTAGGMLASGIPQFILPQQIVQDEIGYIKGVGVEIKTGTSIGKDLTLDDLFRLKYKAIFIATGAGENVKLDIPGADLKGFFYGLTFLQDVNFGKKVRIGKKVVVIGGGETAIDAARVALRLKAEDVTIVYRRSEKEMPAHVREIGEAKSEGVKIIYQVAPVRVLGTNDHVTGIECIRMGLGELDTDGRRRPIPIKGSEFSINVDTVIAAIGENPDLSFLSGGEQLYSTERKTLKVNFDTLATNRPGIFAGGDVVTGPSRVVDAIAAGHKGAESINRYLQGEEVKPVPSLRKEVFQLTREMIPPFLTRKGRWAMTSLPTIDAPQSFQETKLGYSKEQAIREAERCLYCKMCGVCISETADICLKMGSKLMYVFPRDSAWWRGFWD